LRSVLRGEAQTYFGHGYFYLEKPILQKPGGPQKKKAKEDSRGIVVFDKATGMKRTRYESQEDLAEAMALEFLRKKARIGISRVLRREAESYNGHKYYCSDGCVPNAGVYYIIQNCEETSLYNQDTTGS
jgi:hypothetical protein